MARKIIKTVSILSPNRTHLNENLEELYEEFSNLSLNKVPYTGATSDVDIGDNSLITNTIESDGDLTITCSSNKTLLLTNEVWDDFRFPLTLGHLGANSKPDYDYTNNGLLFPQNNTGEVAYIIAQLPHSYSLGTDLSPHLHFIQSSSSVPVFKLKYRWYIAGAAVPSFTTITSSSLVHTYTSGSIHQKALFPTIDGSSINSTSSILDIQIWRDDNVVSGDVLVKEFDIHYKIDTIGSREESTK